MWQNINGLELKSFPLSLSLNFIKPHLHPWNHFLEIFSFFSLLSENVTQQTPLLLFQKNIKIFQDLSLNHCRSSPFSSLSLILTQMASASGHATRSNKDKEIPLASNIEAFPVKNNQVHAPKFDLDTEKAKIWQSQVLISYFVSATVYAFLGPYPDSKLNPKEIMKSFPGYEDRIPRIFSNDTPNISFISQMVFRSYPSFLHTSTYLKCLKKVEAKKAQFWENLGIFNLIQFLRLG